jgi:hypothetical protein
MKKALVVFLILAVAGGLFAQTVTWSGSANTGIAFGFTDEEGNKPLVDFVRNRGEHGARGDISVAFRSAADAPYGTYGADVGIRVRENFFADGGLSALPIQALVFWQPSSLLYLQIGNGGPNPYGTMGGLGQNLGIMDSEGLKIRITPGGGLDIGAQAFYGYSTPVTVFENMNYAIGVKYSSSPVDVAANARYYAENKDDSTKEKFRFGAGVNFKGLSGLGLTKLAVDVATRNLSTDNFYLGIGEAVDFAAGDLSLTGGFQQYLWMGTGSKDVIPMRFHAGISYKVSPIVTIGAEGRYLLGAHPAFNWRNAGEVGGVDSVDAFSAKNVAGLGISPQITFNVGPTINVGYNLQMDMSDPKPARSMQHLIYGTVAISF